ncbi:hypothetical protein D3C80_997040 [compost metagenome]
MTVTKIPCDFNSLTRASNSPCASLFTSSPLRFSMSFWKKLLTAVCSFLRKTEGLTRSTLSVTCFLMIYNRYFAGLYLLKRNDNLTCMSPIVGKRKYLFSIFLSESAYSRICVTFVLNNFVVSAINYNWYLY